MVRFMAVLLTGLALIAPGAHLFEMANKMPLSRDEYLVAQKLYMGWWTVGLLLRASLMANLLLAYADRNFLALGAATFILMNLVTFYFLTYPVNGTTENWTVMPENWEALRRQWELSHAVNAGVTFSAFNLSIAAVLKPR